MKKIIEFIGELQTIYNIFTLDDSEKVFIETELKKIKTSKVIWLQEYIEFVLNELEEGKHKLGKILTSLKTKNKILVSDIEYFNFRVNNGIANGFRKTIKDNYEENFDDDFILFSPIRQELIGSIGNYSETLSKLNEIVELWAIDKDRDYYYFEISNEEPLEHNDKEKNNITSPYDYYEKISEKNTKKEVEKKNIIILKNLQLLSKDGKDSITIKNKEKLLCELIFSDGYLRDGNFNFLTIEEEIYDGEYQNKETIKGLIKRVKSKLIKLGYPKNIFEVTDETLIVKKAL